MAKVENGIAYIKGKDGKIYKVGNITDAELEEEEFSEFQRAMDHLATYIPTTYEEINDGCK